MCNIIANYYSLFLCEFAMHDELDVELISKAKWSVWFKILILEPNIGRLMEPWALLKGRPIELSCHCPIYYLSFELSIIKIGPADWSCSLDRKSVKKNLGSFFLF